MKLNLFNGIIVFEGSMSELKGVMAEMDNMTPKLVDLQIKTNESVITHQAELAKIELDKQKNGIRGQPGYQQ